jgi:hypothetical protein
MACAWDCVDRCLVLLLALGLAASGAAAQELLPLGELMPREHEFSAGLDLAWAHRADREQTFKYRGGLELAGGRLALAGPLGELSEARGGAGLRLGPMRFVLGGIGGRWGEGLLLGARRRPSLGEPARPDLGAGDLPGAASSSASPLLRGISASLELAGGERGRLDLSWRPPGQENELIMLGLRWRHLGLDLQSMGESRALGLSWRGTREAASWSLGIAFRSAQGDVPRRGTIWRLRLRAGPGECRLAALLLAGPTAPEGEGWLGGDAGRELHAAYLGETAGWRWRLARRWREGIGLGAGARRRESSLRLERSLPPGRLRLDLRQIETGEQVELSASPGFPRREQQDDLRQELGLSFRGPWRLTWRRRLDDGAAGILVLGGSPPGWPILDLQLSRYEVDPGARAWLLFEGGALHRSVEALRGRGWRLGARVKLGDGARRLRAGLSWRRDDGGDDLLAIWCELGSALR